MKGMKRKRTGNLWPVSAGGTLKHHTHISKGVPKTWGRKNEKGVTRRTYDGSGFDDVSWKH